MLRAGGLLQEVALTVCFLGVPSQGHLFPHGLHPFPSRMFALAGHCLRAEALPRGSVPSCSGSYSWDTGEDAARRVRRPSGAARCPRGSWRSETWGCLVPRARFGLALAVFMFALCISLLPGHGDVLARSWCGRQQLRAALVLRMWLFALWASQGVRRRGWKQAADGA